MAVGRLSLFAVNSAAVSVVFKLFFKKPWQVNRSRLSLHPANGKTVLWEDLGGLGIGCNGWKAGRREWGLWSKKYFPENLVEWIWPLPLHSQSKRGKRKGVIGSGFWEGKVLKKALKNGCGVVAGKMRFAALALTGGTLRSSEFFEILETTALFYFFEAVAILQHKIEG